MLLVYQVNEEIIHGRFPLNRDLAVELASLMAQVPTTHSILCQDLLPEISLIRLKREYNGFFCVRSKLVSKALCAVSLPDLD